jgi:PAS domain S-box-containing protein
MRRYCFLLSVKNQIKNMKNKKILSVLVLHGSKYCFSQLQQCLQEALPDALVVQQQIDDTVTAHISEKKFDLVILDFSFGSGGIDNCLEKIGPVMNEAAVIVLKRKAQNWSVIERIKLDVQDCICKEELTGIALYKSIIYSIERKKNTDVLRFYEEKFSCIYNSHPASIFLVEAETYRIIDVNNTAEKQCSYTREELLKKHFTDFFFKCKPGLLLSKNQVAEIGLDCKIDQLLWKHRRKNGEVKYINFCLHQIRYNNKPVIVVMGTDVTKLFLLERRLRQERQKRKQELSKAIIIGQEQQRIELGAELHDNVNQLLATTRLFLGCALKSRKYRIKLITDSRNNLVTAINEIRQLSKKILPPAWGKSSLKDALEDLINSLRISCNVNFIFTWKDFNESNCNDNLKLAIYRIVQEQLTNIMRHAAASNIEIQLWQKRNRLLLQIKDDGIGFNTSERKEGVGIQNINYRTEMHKGVMSLKSEPGKGCNLLLRFPLKTTQ